MTAETPRVLSAPFYSAYLKIAEGCNNRCSFCTIPAMRGPFRSRPLTDLLQETDWLAPQGVKELNLVAQDTTAYGSDLHPRASLPELLEALAARNYFSWIRVLYGHPEKITRRLLEVMASEDSICSYLDLPLQHVSGRVLAAMGRSGSAEKFHELIGIVREWIPDITLRTTLIVGFPGETDADFQELCDFVQQARFQRLGLFGYSAERGTRAARLSNPVEKSVKEQRLRVLADLQEKISRGYNTKLVGTIKPVLIEGTSNETDLLLQGRLATQAPEVDGFVLINKGFAQVGKIMPVRITEAHPHDLIGEIVEGELF
jgi:ribosomal protein S12 methylthiotransferase